ncbi:hypothetical protein DBA20_01940 [Pandoraea capi]|nr:hypothetical protein [Pandoraea sp. LA3]MDN4581748.1 hypothetical protein [Pandoraea capi]
MQVYEGELLEGGVSSADGRWKKYTYLKIGNQQVNNVRIDMNFDRVLHGQINRGSIKLTVDRWFSKDIIIGITQADGQTFRPGLGQFYLQLAIPGVIGIVALLVTLASGSALGLIPAALMFLACSVPWKFISKVKAVKADHVY